MGIFKRCHDCGGPLELTAKDTTVLCGAIDYYICLVCHSLWKEDQTGIVSRPANLEKVDSLPPHVKIIEKL